MGSWGLLILFASLVNQYFFPPNFDYLIVMWSVVTVLGLAAQVICLARGLGPNLAAWVVVIVVGWLFTYLRLYLDMAGVWLLLLGVGYVATAIQVHARFWILAALHFVAGGLMELSVHKMLPLPWLDANQSLVFGLVAGVPLIIGALPFWYAPKRAV
jgi:hypothetical protein